MTRGIDVSFHNGLIDWQKVYTEVDFAFIRLGYSLYNGGIKEDINFKANIEGARAAEIPVGVYVYAYDTTPKAASISAQTVAKMLEDYKVDIGIAYDMEDEQYTKWSREANQNILRAFLDNVEKPVFYSYEAFITQCLDSSALTNYPVWVANTTGKDPAIPWRIWQYSHKGRVSGIDTVVDLNKAISLPYYTETPPPQTTTNIDDQLYALAKRIIELVEEKRR